MMLVGILEYVFFHLVVPALVVVGGICIASATDVGNDEWVGSLVVAVYWILGLFLWREAPTLVCFRGTAGRGSRGSAGRSPDAGEREGEREHDLLMNGGGANGGDHAPPSVEVDSRRSSSADGRQGRQSTASTGASSEAEESGTSASTPSTEEVVLDYRLRHSRLRLGVSAFLASFAFPSFVAKLCCCYWIMEQKWTPPKIWVIVGVAPHFRPDDFRDELALAFLGPDLALCIVGLLSFCIGRCMNRRLHKWRQPRESLDGVVSGPEGTSSSRRSSAARGRLPSGAHAAEEEGEYEDDLDIFSLADADQEADSHRRSSRFPEETSGTHYKLSFSEETVCYVHGVPLGMAALGIACISPTGWSLLYYVLGVLLMAAPAATAAAAATATATAARTPTMRSTARTTSSDNTCALTLLTGAMIGTAFLQLTVGEILRIARCELGEGDAAICPLLNDVFGGRFPVAVVRMLVGARPHLSHWQYGIAFAAVVFFRGVGVVVAREKGGEDLADRRAAPLTSMMDHDPRDEEAPMWMVDDPRAAASAPAIMREPASVINTRVFREDSAALYSGQERDLATSTPADHHAAGAASTASIAERRAPPKLYFSTLFAVLAYYAKQIFRYILVNFYTSPFLFALPLCFWAASLNQCLLTISQFIIACVGFHYTDTRNGLPRCFLGFATAWSIFSGKGWRNERMSKGQVRQNTESMCLR